MKKIEQLLGEPGYGNIDIPKVRSVMKMASELKQTNDEMKTGIHSFGVLVNQLAQSSVGLKKNVFISSESDVHMKDIAQSIDSLNHLFNDIYLKVMESDTRINDVKVTCKAAQSYQGHLYKYDILEQEYTKIEAMNF